ncbi:F0F1 ATP synthase subunit alpha [Patescibacteria group bacterium]|nr:F0F1 ATP synthase subunit alpha [Patescibacteria group bacterium]
MPELLKKETGHINALFSGVAICGGFPYARLHEVILDSDGRPGGIVVGFREDYTEVLLFSERKNVGRPFFRSNTLMSIPVSERYIGRVVDGTGTPVDKHGAITGQLRPLFTKAPAIFDRKPVSRPFVTGIKIIDTVLPIGRGQRELIIGDRKLGKTTIAVDTILNQGRMHKNPPVCIYVSCGKKVSELEEIIRLFTREGAMTYTAVVAATADSPFASQYLAPFTGTTIGEYFRDLGSDVLIVYDDLTKHAASYRDISLLLSRAPGREAYPGDVFSLHAGLLERAGQLSDKRKGGSLTALPIVETQEGDLTSFISTNIISITDGQIYLERGLFQKRFLPAINVGLSVSRIGSKGQPDALREVTGGLRLALAQHRELQKLTQIETVLSQAARRTIERGELILELLKQDKHILVDWPVQVVLFYAAEQGYFDDIELDTWRGFEDLVVKAITTKNKRITETISRGTFDDKTREDIRLFISSMKKDFVSPV